MDILSWDYPTPDNDDTEPNPTDLNLPAADRKYDLWELNCCVVRDAYYQGDTTLWDRVFAHWDKVLPH